MKRFLAKHSPLLILAALSIVLAIADQDFGKPYNLQSVAERTCVVAIMALGQVLVIIAAGIDLSVGSVAALSGVAAALLVKDAGLPVFPAMVLGSGVGLGCGIVNGALVTKGRIPAFIVSLGMMMMARGGALLLSGGLPVRGLPKAFQWLGGPAGWWIPVVVTAICAIIFAVGLGFSRFGRALYAVGGNLTASRLSGIPVDAVRTAAFALSGLMAGFGGVMLASRTAGGDPNAAQGYELDVIAACVIGGASLMGGEGGAIRAVAGALIMSVLVNFCNLNDISVYWQQVLIGALIIVLVFYDQLRKRRAGLLTE